MLKRLTFPTLFAEKDCSEKFSATYILNFIIITLLACQSQNMVYFSWDNSILLHETERLLVGGSYAKNYFETSPPMIFYLYMPVVLLVKFFSLPLIATFRAYIFSLTFFCLWLYHSLTKQIFLPADPRLRYVSFFSLMAILLIFPSFELGQRDCLLVLLSIPYLMAAVIRIENKSIYLWQAITIGLLAGLGVGIKPHFLILPVLIESYLLLATKNWRICLRPEAVAMVAVLLLYTAILLHKHLDYFTVIVPYASRLYYSGIGQNWSTIILDPVNLFGASTIAFFLIQRFSLGPYKTFATILCLALISYLLIFTLQRVTFYYHIIPPLSFMLFLNIILIFITFKQPLAKKNTIKLFILSLLNLELLAHNAGMWIVLCAFNPLAIWIFIIFCSLIILYLIYGKTILSLLLLPLLAIGSAAWYSPIVAQTFLPSTIISNPYFCEAICLSLVLFIIVVRHKNFTKTTLAILAITTITACAYPVSVYYRMYLFNSDYAFRVSPILAYLKNHTKNHSIYLFASGSRRLFPLIDYAQTISVSRFPFFWMLPGLLNHSGLTSHEQLAQRIKDKNFLIDMVTEDLKTKKPDYVFIDVSTFKENIPNPFQFLPYFLSSKNFQAEWKNYQFATIINEDMSESFVSDNRFDFAVYRRQPQQS